MPDRSVIALEWATELKGYKLSRDAQGAERIVRRGRKSEPRRYALPDNLFQIFIKVVTDTDGLLRFMQDYGPLTAYGLGHVGQDGGERVLLVLHQARMMREIYQRAAATGKRPRFRADGIIMSTPASVEAAAVWSETEKAWHFELRPKYLMDALWLQFAQFLVGDQQLRTCKHCGTIFEAGRGTGRRLDAQFCSDEHRISFNSLRRSKEA